MRPRVAVVTATAAAVVLGAVLSASAVDASPLNVDEELTRRIAGGRFGAIFSIVAQQRGGGPLHFWLVHLTLQWPGGLAGLRVPSLVFFLLALPAVALIACELAGWEAAVVTVLLTACAPLAVTYASFARPHTLLLAWISWGTVAALRAARTGRGVDWLVAGAVLGTAIFSHPTAPLYALSAFAAAVACSTSLRRAWPGAAALLVATIPYEAFTAHRLTDRYQVGNGTVHGRTFDGKPVWENALRFLAAGHVVSWLSALALAGVVALVLQRRYRVLAAIAVIVVVPVLFFSWVPANGLSALFFNRYVLPPLPLFLLLVSVGAVAIARLAGRAWPIVLTALAIGALAVQLSTVRRHTHNIAKLELNHVTSVVRSQSAGAVLFGSAGTLAQGGFLGDLNFGRGPALLDRYLSLRIPKLPLVNDDTCVPVVAYLRGPATPRRGLFLFYANSADQQAAAAAAFARLRGLHVQVPAPRYFLLRTTRPLAPRSLVEAALRIRRAWVAAEPANPRAHDLVASDAQALDAPDACVPRGPLGDPDISPHYPEVVT